MEVRILPGTDKPELVLLNSDPGTFLVPVLSPFVRRNPIIGLICANRPLFQTYLRNRQPTDQEVEGSNPSGHAPKNASYLPFMARMRRLFVLGRRATSRIRLQDHAHLCPYSGPLWTIVSCRVPPMALPIAKSDHHFDGKNHRV